MDNQTPTIGIMIPEFTGSQNGQNQYNTVNMNQTVPPPYCPNPGQQIPWANPNPSGFPNQPNGAPGGLQSAHPQATNVVQTGVTVQPTVVMAQMPAVTAVPDYLFYSIFNMLFCCLPLGIAAVIYSSFTRDANLAGQRELAMSHSRVALILNNVALCLGLTIITVSLIVIFTI